MEADLAHGAAQAGADRAQAEYLRSEAARTAHSARQRAIALAHRGHRVTPALQNAAGEHLDAGAPFAQVLDLSSAVVDIAVPQQDAALLSLGATGRDQARQLPATFLACSRRDCQPPGPAGRWRSHIRRACPAGELRRHAARGMTGRGKIFIGFRPAGYVLLPGPHSGCGKLCGTGSAGDSHESRNFPNDASGLSSQCWLRSVLMLGAGCDARPAGCRLDVWLHASVLCRLPLPLRYPHRLRSSSTPEPKSFTTNGPLVAEQQADVAAERDGRVASNRGRRSATG